MKLFTHVASFMLFALPLFAFAQITPVWIIDEPRPDLPKDYGTLDVQGSFLLKVEFLGKGKIGRINVA